jgi:hypothetical protein
MHLTINLNSVCGLSEPSVVYIIATYGHQTFKSPLCRLQHGIAGGVEQKFAKFSNACGNLYCPTPSTLRILLIEACDFGDFCIASANLPSSELSDEGIGEERTIEMDICCPTYSGAKPILHFGLVGRKASSKMDPNPTTTPIDQPQTEAVRTDRLEVQLAAFGEPMLKYKGLPPAPTNLTELQVAVRRRSLGAGPEHEEPKQSEAPAPEETRSRPAEPKKERRNSLMDTFVEKISEVSSNINKASSQVLHSVDTTVNRGIHKLNDIVESLVENTSQQRFQTFFPECARTETLLAEFECESLAPTGKLYPGYMMLTTHSIGFISKQLTPTMFRFRMEFVNILSLCRVLINGNDAIQIFDLDHNMAQLQHFANFGTSIAEGVCNTLSTPMITNALSTPLSANLFSRVFKQSSMAWQSRAELPPPEFNYNQSQILVMD